MSCEIRIAQANLMCFVHYIPAKRLLNHLFGYCSRLGIVGITYSARENGRMSGTARESFIAVTAHIFRGRTAHPEVNKDVDGRRNARNHENTR